MLAKAFGESGYEIDNIEDFSDRFGIGVVNEDTVDSFLANIAIRNKCILNEYNFNV